MTWSTSATPSLIIRLFGPVDVRLHGRPLPPLRSRTGFWLLALLTLRQGREVARDWLAGTLWPDSTQSQAFANLRISLADLRQAMGDQAGRLRSSSSRLLCLDLHESQVDVLDFDTALARGDAASLEQAVALYRGPLLEGCGEAWLLLERQAREQMYLRAVESLAVHSHTAGDYALAAQQLRAVIAIDPTREEAQRALLRALAAGGDFAAATQAYRDLRLWLHRELNAEPDPETRALYEQLHCQVQQRARTTTLPRIDTPAKTPPRRLPHPLTGLVGRETEMTAVQACLRKSRLVTLTGAGGVGKTRLAIAVAEAVVEHFPDGAWFVDLAALTEPALVSQTLGVALEVPEEGGRPRMDTLLTALRERALLVVLDNCEHLIAACAQMVETLLEGCVHLKVLATSRQVLGLTGEAAWRVPSLALPDLDHLHVEDKTWVAHLSEYAAIRLFVERALLARQDFRLTSDNAREVAQVCIHLDGIPLAIELAAARVRVLSVKQIVSRLDDRFQLLTGSGRATFGRQQTLRTTLDWSYELLREPEKALFMRLSVFAGGNTLDAAEAVCCREGVEAWEMLDVLTDLVDKSLVSYEEREGEGRYRLLETVRHYSREKLIESGQNAACQSQHLDYFLALAERAYEQLMGAEQAAWLQRLEREHDNLRSALDLCQEEPDRAEVGLRLAGALQRFWWTRGYLTEGRERLAALLARPGAQKHTPARARALNGAGVLARSQGDYTAARSLHEESLALKREAGDRQGIAMSLGNLALIATDQGDYEASRALLEESLAISREWGDTRRIATTLMNLGIVARKQGDLGASRALLEESLAMAQELGDKSGIADSLNSLGLVVLNQGDYSAARPLYERSLAIKRELGNKVGIAVSLDSLGNVALYQGDYSTARLLYEESLALERELGNKHGMVCSYISMTLVLSKQGDYGTAHACLAQCLTLCGEIGSKREAIFALEACADLARLQQRLERAVRLYGAAQALRQTIGSPQSPGDQEEHRRHLAELEARLDRDIYASTFAMGQAMRFEAALAYALEEAEVLSDSSSPGG